LLEHHIQTQLSNSQAVRAKLRTRPLAADGSHKIAEVFGTRLHRRHRGKLYTIIDQIAHGHHVFRVYFRNAVLRQYEKFSILLRNELCSNNLYDFGLRKDLEHLDEVRHKFQANVGVVLSKM